MKRPLSITVILIYCALASLMASTRGNAQSKISQIYKIDDEGNKWDYLATSGQNLYISHGDRVNIVDKSTGKDLGVITGTEGVHGIAFVPGLHKGYISDGKADQVTVFDMTTFKTLLTIKTGKDPDAIFYDHFTHKVITCNGRDHSLSILDPETDKVIKTIDVGGKPETAVSDETGKLYVNIEDKSEIAAVDLNACKVLQHWPLAPGEGPSGLAIDRNTKRLFAGCDNKQLIVMHAGSGKVVASLPIGSGCDGVVFDTKNKRVYSSNADGTLSVIQEKLNDQYVVLKQFPTKKGARTIALDEETQALYLPTANFETAREGGKERWLCRAVSRY